MPPGLKRTVRRVLLALAAVVIGVAAVLVAAQQPFAASRFEFQQYRDFQGILRSSPYPALSATGQDLPWLLVFPGKHGADALGRFDGREVRLRGTRVWRDSDRMLEVLPESIQAGGRAGMAQATDLGRVELTGEILDSKCYFGVMNPGNGKVHRDCAVRCISGGVPPAFLVRDARGVAATLLIDGITPELLHHVAEPLTLCGRLTRTEGRLVLHPE